MKNEAELPSCLRPPIFMIGQDSRGHWVARDLSGRRGGLFVNRAEALRYIRSENGNRPHSFVTITGIIELDMTGIQNPASQRQHGAETERQLWVA
jgi:hypothetical protein